MVAVGEAVDQRHAQRLDPGRLQRCELGADVVHVQGGDHAAVAGDPLVGLDGVLQRRQRFGLGPDDPAGQTAGDEGPGDLQDLPEALRGDESDPGALVLEDRVGRDGGAVQDLADVGQRDVSVAADALYAAQHALGLVGGGGGGLAAPRPSAVGVDEEDVGERATDVDSEPIRHCSCLLGERGSG